MKYDPILYDSDPRPFLKDEVDFYIKLIDKLKAKTILELGVGTGRIFSKLLPLVKAGEGIDISESMLTVCKNKCVGNKNYKLHKLSFTDFNLQTTFDLIYLPFNTFQHLLTEEEQIKCLKNIKAHMHIGSRFILDVINGDNLTFDFENWKQDYVCTLPGGEIVEREQKTIEVNPKTFVVHKIFRYKEIIDGKIDKTYEFEAQMKITPNEKMKEILGMVGFKIEDTWSDYIFGYSNDAKKRIYCLKSNEI